MLPRILYELRYSVVLYYVLFGCIFVFMNSTALRDTFSNVLFCRCIHLPRCRYNTIYESLIFWCTVYATFVSIIWTHSNSVRSNLFLFGILQRYVELNCQDVASRHFGHPNAETPFTWFIINLGSTLRSLFVYFLHATNVVAA